MLVSVCRCGSKRCWCLSVGLAPDWVEEGNDDDASVVGGTYFVPDPSQPASACPSQPLATDLDKTECGVSVSDTAGGQLGFSHLTLGQWSVLADQHSRNDISVSQGDTDGGGVSFDATAPTALTHSCSVDSTGATWCVDEYQGVGAPGGQGEDIQHHAGVSADPLMTDPCLVAPPCGGRSRQVMLSYSASDSLSTCLDTVTDTSSATDRCDWYQPGSDSQHYSDGWAPGTATVYGLNPSDTPRMQDTTATQWCGSHDMAPHSCYGNSTWYYSGGEQAGGLKPAAVKKIQQVRCVDMPVTNGNSVCVGGPDTVGVDHCGGRAFVGDQLESPSYRIQEHASSQCYQWRQPCTGYSSFQF